MGSHVDLTSTHTKNNIDMERRPIPGWRSFFCDCGYSWTSAVRDWLSPSMEGCPRCYEEVFPKGEGPDPSLAIDSSGNLKHERIKTPAFDG